MKKCRFVIQRNGRVRCAVHHQTLMYLFSNGQKICQVGEDELISNTGFEAYLKKINEAKL